jgi:hypothetical protein
LPVGNHFLPAGNHFLPAGNHFSAITNHLLAIIPPAKLSTINYQLNLTPQGVKYL